MATTTNKTVGVAIGTEMGPSYANLFVGFTNTHFSVNTTAPKLNSTVAKLTIASLLERSTLNL